MNRIDRRPTGLASKLFCILSDKLGLLWALVASTNITVCWTRDKMYATYVWEQWSDLAKKQSSKTVQRIITGLQWNIASILSKYYNLLKPNS